MTSILSDKNERTNKRLESHVARKASKRKKEAAKFKDGKGRERKLEADRWRQFKGRVPEVFKLAA